MFSQTKRFITPRRVYWTIVILSFLLSGYYVLVYYQEQDQLALKARDIVNAANAGSKEEQVRALQSFIRTHVRPDGLEIEGRPFFRASAREILETGKGYCGEATRAFICLARHLGIQAQRVNLYGRLNHVVAEVELEPGRWVLVDVQENENTNGLLDRAWWGVYDVVLEDGSPFIDYSNLHLRRLPVINLFVQRIKMRNGYVTWILENPALIKAWLFGFIGVSMMLIWFVDRVLRRVYARRLGVPFPRR